MKILFIVLLSLISTFGYSKTVNDTIGIAQSEISKWIMDTSTKTPKYYCIYKNNLLTTSKTAYEKVKLCNKYGAKCALILIGNKKNKVFIPKKVILN